MQRDDEANRRRSEAIREGRDLSIGESRRTEAPGDDPLRLSSPSPYPMPDHSWQRGSTFTDTGSYSPTMMPPPLNTKAREELTQQDQPLKATTTSRLTGPIDNNKSRGREHVGFEDVPLDDIPIRAPDPFADPFATSLPRRTKRPARSSWKRLSLTPSEMPYPLHLMNPTEPDDFAKAEAMLGLRRHSRPPPVPAKPWLLPAQAKDATSTTRQIPAHVEPEPIPEDTLASLNGRMAWLHAVTGMLVVFNCWGLSNAFGLFEAYYKQVYLRGTSPSAIAWIGSTQLALVFGLGVPVGWMVDQGYFRLVFHGGSVIMVLGIFATSVCSRIWSLWLVSGLVTGLGMGMCFCSGVVALMTWFDERHIGIAMALCAAGSSLGAITYVLLARHFLETASFHTTFLVLGSIAATTLIPANLVFRVRGQRHGRKPRRPAPTPTPSDPRPHPRPSHRATLLTAPYILTVTGLFLAFLGLYLTLAYLPLYAVTQLHLTQTAATNLLLILLAANLPGRILPGLISDTCLGPLNTLIPCCILSAAVVGLWIATSSGAGRESAVSLAVIAGVYGFVSAGVQALYAPAVHSLCLEVPGTEGRRGAGAVAQRHLGLHSGIPFSAIGVACLIGLPIGGALISARREAGLGQEFLGAQVFAAGCLLGGGVLLAAGRVARVGWGAGRA